MKLVNTDGMAFIGPGSEWFWTALSGIILAITFIAIYRQLSLARAASSREEVASFSRDWGTERMIRHRLAVLLDLHTGQVAAEDLRTFSAAAIGGFWEDIGALCRTGDRDARLLSRTAGQAVVVWWAGLAPAVRKYRAELNNPLFYEDFEWLAGVMTEMEPRGHDPQSLEDQWRGTELQRRIQQAREALLVEQAIRTVIVASPDATFGGPPSRKQRPAAPPSPTFQG